MIRITRHPRDHAFLLLKVPHDLNAQMGGYGPAQLAPDLGGYVIAADQLDSLQSWARYQGVRVLNEVRDKAEPTKPLECGNITETWTTNDGREIHEPCCAPYPLGRIPKFCGACGQPANPVTYDASEPSIGVRCAACGRVNQGGPRFCVSCGERLPDRHLSVPAVPRAKSEPKPLGEVIGELSDTLRPHVAPELTP